MREMRGRGSGVVRVGEDEEGKGERERVSEDRFETRVTTLTHFAPLQFPSLHGSPKEGNTPCLVLVPERAKFSSHIRRFRGGRSLYRWGRQATRFQNNREDMLYSQVLLKSNLHCDYVRG